MQIINISVMNRPSKSLTTMMYPIENFESLHPVLTLEFMRRSLTITHELQYAVVPTGLTIDFHRRSTVVDLRVLPELVACKPVTLGIYRRSLVAFVSTVPDATKVDGLQLGLLRRSVVVFNTKQPEATSIKGLTISISRTVK